MMTDSRATSRASSVFTGQSFAFSDTSFAIDSPIPRVPKVAFVSDENATSAPCTPTARRSEAVAPLHSSSVQQPTSILKTPGRHSRSAAATSQTAPVNPSSFKVTNTASAAQPLYSTLPPRREPATPSQRRGRSDREASMEPGSVTPYVAAYKASIAAAKAAADAVKELPTAAVPVEGKAANNNKHATTSPPRPAGNALKKAQEKMNMVTPAVWKNMKGAPQGGKTAEEVEADEMSRLSIPPMNLPPAADATKQQHANGTHKEAAKQREASTKPAAKPKAPKANKADKKKKPSKRRAPSTTSEDDDYDDDDSVEEESPVRPPKKQHRDEEQPRAKSKPLKSAPPRERDVSMMDRLKQRNAHKSVPLHDDDDSDSGEVVGSKPVGQRRRLSGLNLQRQQSVPLDVTAALLGAQSSPVKADGRHKSTRAASNGHGPTIVRRSGRLDVSPTDPSSPEDVYDSMSEDASPLGGKRANKKPRQPPKAATKTKKAAEAAVMAAQPAAKAPAAASKGKKPTAAQLRAAQQEAMRRAAEMAAAAMAAKPPRSAKSNANREVVFVDPSPPQRAKPAQSRTKAAAASAPTTRRTAGNPKGSFVDYDEAIEDPDLLQRDDDESYVVDDAAVAMDLTDRYGASTDRIDRLIDAQFDNLPSNRHHAPPANPFARPQPAAAHNAPYVRAAHALSDVSQRINMPAQQYKSSIAPASTRGSLAPPQPQSRNVSTTRGASSATGGNLALSFLERCFPNVVVAPPDMSRFKGGRQMPLTAVGGRGKPKRV